MQTSSVLAALLKAPLSLAYYTLFSVFYCIQLAYDILQNYSIQLTLFNWPIVTKSPPKSLVDLKANVSSFKKIPRYIALVINHNSIDSSKLDYGAVAKVVCWCVGAGISYITIYDLHGAFNKESEQISKHIEAFAETFFDDKSAADKIKVSWSNGIPKDSHALCSCDQDSADKTQPVESASRGKTRRDDFNERAAHHVQILSGQDGRPRVVAAVRSLVRSAHAGTLDPHEITIPVLSSHFTPIPGALPADAPDEPELILHFSHFDGKDTHVVRKSAPLVLDGFLPWHIRLSEVVHIAAPLEDCPLASFIDALAFYTRTEKSTVCDRINSETI